MAELKTAAFAGLVRSRGTASADLFVDTNILINFDRIGKLDAILAANRLIVITPEVRREAVDDALASGNPAVVASALRIDQWIESNKTAGRVQVVASDPNREPFTGPGAGERSIVADVAYLNGAGNPVIVSDDNDIALTNVPGSSAPVLTGNYFLNSLLLGGAITPNDYFEITGAGAASGFNGATLPGDASSKFVNGQQYELVIDGVQRGTFEYRTVGSSSITLDGRTIDFAPYQKGGIQDGLILKVSDLGNENHTEQLVDASNHHTWSEQITSYNATDAVTSIDTRNDDGTRVTNFFDPANTSWWYSYTDTYDAGGHLLTQTFDRDDGTHARVHLDPTNATWWSHYIDEYDASWRLLTQTFDRDDGTLRAGAFRPDQRDLVVALHRRTRRILAAADADFRPRRRNSRTGAFRPDRYDLVVANHRGVRRGLAPVVGGRHPSSKEKMDRWIDGTGQTHRALISPTSRGGNRN